ncbi:hypothetical protein COE30_21080 [Bacillus cereus]|uniref:hypothetical protein n=1 Tax=Bacillus cereus TaxID=1396 RepID=UPI000BFD872E|nr:hypothetical protein [Bacillus cereus]PGZ06553.1 hypothetical protein COE30_21080 [Bacillus cereus]
MTVRCLIIDAYKAPGSNMTQREFSKHVAQVQKIWGDQCNLDIRWRFQDRNQTPIMKDIEGPIVTTGRIPDGLIPDEAKESAPPELFPETPNVLTCGDYNSLPDNIQNPGSDPSFIKQWLAKRPGMDDSPFGQTRPLDIAVYYVQGPFLGDGALGCGGYYTPSGPAIVITNNLPDIITPQNNVYIYPRSELILAHELGHVLLKYSPNAGHVDNDDNIMYKGLLKDHSIGVTEDQCTEAKKSEYFQDCP